MDIMQIFNHIQKARDGLNKLCDEADPVDEAYLFAAHAQLEEVLEMLSDGDGEVEDDDDA